MLYEVITLIESRTHVVNSDFARVTYTQAVADSKKETEGAPQKAAKPEKEESQDDTVDYSQPLRNNFV